MFWSEIMSGQFEAAVEKAKGVCAIVVGCMEQHGHHLPLGQDVIFTEGIAERAAEKEPFVLFPSMYFGEKTGAGEFPGTVIFSSKLRFDILTESCDEIARNGFKKILILNGHGGNGGVLANFLRSTAHTKKDYVVMTRNEFQYSHKNLLADIDAGEEFPELTPEDIAYIREAVEEKHACGHGGIMETAILNVINPESVDMSRCNVDDGTSRRRTGYLGKKGIGINGSGNFWLTDYPNSLAGEKLERANARIGKALLRKRIALQAEAVRLLKQDDRVLEWNDEFNAKW